MISRAMGRAPGGAEGECLRSSFRDDSDGTMPVPARSDDDDGDAGAGNDDDDRAADGTLPPDDPPPAAPTTAAP